MIFLEQTLNPNSNYYIVWRSLDGYDGGETLVHIGNDPQTVKDVAKLIETSLNKKSCVIQSYFKMPAPTLINK